MKVSCFCLLYGLLLYVLPARAQVNSGLASQVYALPGKLIDGLSRRVDNVEKNMMRQADRYFSRLLRREQKLKKRLAKKDSAAAENVFGNPERFYSDLSARLSKKTESVSSPFSNVYSGMLDSLRSGVRFMEKSGLLKQAVGGQLQTDDLLSKYNELQTTFNRTEAIKKILGNRQQFIGQQLQQWNIPGVQALQKQVYYYRAQMDEYKRIWEDPSVLERKLIGVLCKMPAFRQFFDQYSDLAAVFQLSGNTQPLAISPDLQTRDRLNQFVQASYGTAVNPQSQIQNNLPASSDPLSALRPSVPSLSGEGGSENAMPGFKPNQQKVKSFFKRLEFGSTIQTSKASYFFPATSDIGLSLGYRLNDKSIIGIGSGGKIGWGRGWNHIQVSGQGLSLRSFVDIKLKGSVWISGGWEYHYQQPVAADGAQYDISKWKQQGLLGLSKVVRIKSTSFKKYRIQLFYDFLYKYEQPVTEPLKLRMGYTF